MSKIAIDATRCTRCGTCIATCPGAIFESADNGAVPNTVHESLCVSCGHCVAVCPHDAIQHPDFAEGSVNPINRELLPSYEQVLELLRARRSSRVFEDEQIERSLLEKIIEAARFAPTAHNTQSTEYVVIQDKATLRRISELTLQYFAKTAKQLRNPIARTLFRVIAGNMFESIVGMLPDLDLLVEAAHRGQDMILRGAPCLIICHAKVSVHFPEQNAALAVHNATLAAETLGLGSFQVGYIVGASKREKNIARLLGIPKNHEIYAALALGRPKKRFEKWVERRRARARWM